MKTHSKVAPGVGKHVLPINSIVIALIFVLYLVGWVDSEELFKPVIKQSNKRKQNQNNYFRNSTLTIQYRNGWTHQITSNSVVNPAERKLRAKVKWKTLPRIMQQTMMWKRRTCGNLRLKKRELKQNRELNTEKQVSEIFGNLSKLS